MATEKDFLVKSSVVAPTSLQVGSATITSSGTSIVLPANSTIDDGAGGSVNIGSPDLTGYATETYVNNAVGAIDLSGYVTTSTIANYLTISSFNSQIAGYTTTVDLNNALALKANTSSLATVATTGNYNDLSNTPSLFSGSYTDLTNKPSIPTLTSQLTNDAGFITTSALSGYAQLSAATNNFTGNIQIDGNLTVSGTQNIINTTDLAVEDNMIYLNSTSIVANPDLGFAGNYNDGTYAHTGLFRDASDGRWKFYDSYTPEPDASAFIDTTHGSFNLATVQAGAFIGDGSQLTGVGGGISYSVKTSNYSASADEGIIADTSAGSFTITLPFSPSVGDQVVIADGADWSTNNLIIGRNSSTISGTAEDLVCDIQGVSIQFVYDGSTWEVYALASGTVSNTLTASDIGVTVQGYDADTAKYDATTANFTGTLQNGGSNVVVDSDIGVTVGYPNIPPVGTKTSNYTLAIGDVGKYVQIGGPSGTITIPNATFSEGDAISIFNNTADDMTIFCSITTAYIAGADSDVASVTLATRGVATILFISSTVCVISGNVS